MVPARAVLFLFDVVKTNVLRESSTSEFSHSLGQSRRFDRTPATSGLPRRTDILRDSRHVSNVAVAIGSCGCGKVARRAKFPLCRRAKHFFESRPSVPR